MSENASDWSADFAAAERHRLEGSLMATPSQRLQWLEEALRFAKKMSLRHRQVEKMRIER
jgi:hypothetical protein